MPVLEILPAFALGAWIALGVLSARGTRRAKTLKPDQAAELPSPAG